MNERVDDDWVRAAKWGLYLCVPSAYFETPTQTDSDKEDIGISHTGYKLLLSELYLSTTYTGVERVETSI